ncbi:MAG: hypothetical protein HZC22_05155 [Rhodocyclales bacterium]|nr:hypothetical protein [Rhodocyclales bacterium]
MRDRVSFRINSIAAAVASALAILQPSIAQADPDACSGSPTSVTCSGDQSAGISRSAPPGELNVLDLSGPIIPYVSGRSGIRLATESGANVLINAGASAQPVTIDTTHSGAVGIIGTATGVPSGNVADDAFLGVPLVGVNPAVPGGDVRITSRATIVTDGAGAHGISAYSASPGYPDVLLNRLAAFTESGFSFTVTEVRNAAGTVVPFSGTSVQVRGHLVDADGNMLTDAEGDPIEHGTFTFHQDGRVDVQYSDAENAAHAALTGTDAIRVAVDYSVEGSRAGNLQSDTGTLLLTWQPDEAGVPGENREAYFATFGVSAKPAAESGATVFPDLKRYVTGLLNEAKTGGAGGSVHVESDGAIETRGTEAHGIHAESLGGAGARGGDGSISHSATGGSPGLQPGNVSVVANGSIATALDKSGGIVAVSAGGIGGAGGDGGHWRWGQKGGTGGTGGTVVVGGSAGITTLGDYASGIVALSVGGNGGPGGSGSGAMPGGGGGFGGKGGEVEVIGGWNITTHGDYSYGIWAKSLGGNAGTGGSGGWLFGDPGVGGVATDGGKVTLHSSGAIETWKTYAYGLYAQSVGGFGGSGGSSWGLFWSFGGDGNSGGSGGEVQLTNDGSVVTHETRSHAIFAQSIGGGGGGGGGEFALIASLGGGGASGGNGGTVTVTNNGVLETHGQYAHAIYAQSVGGGGGDGGNAYGLVGIGGSGSETSDGGNVIVTNTGSADTYEINSHAIYAQSIGGGGGDGGLAVGLVTIGGDGGAGGDAGTVTVSNEGSLHTRKEASHGIFAQSVGGGGGAGGGAVSAGNGITVAIGGDGGTGGIGKAVVIDGGSGSSITTEGNRSYGIYAQSIGGGGGTGGFAIAGSIAGSGTSFNMAVGGDGGNGNHGGTVDVTGSGTITTSGNDAHAILAQSVGGSGGTGGFSVAASIGGGAGVNLSIGGDGGDGSYAEAVRVGSEAVGIGGTITTRGARSHGILAQSIGGGGGDGGASISGNLGSPASIPLSFGGDGGFGGLGGTVDVYADGAIVTHGMQSHGILAQSVGGGGGTGGLSIAGAVTAFGGLSLAMGGTGGEGNTASTVRVVNRGSIDTWNEYSHGIMAQSIGGGGGAGGTAGSVMVNFSSLIPIPEPYPTGSVNISISLGGDGGKGGAAGAVEVSNDGTISTRRDYAYGIYAQSIGGGGGDGGKAIAATANISLPDDPSGGEGAKEPQLEVKVDFAMAVGGSGGEGNVGGDVTVSNRNAIETSGDGAHGIYAQSIGGGGGTGGDARAMILSIDPSNWKPEQPEMPEPGSISVGATLSIGGDGGTGGHAGQLVTVTNTGNITTRGADAYGIFAQSIGGGGGTGGGGYHGLDWEDFGVSEEVSELLDFVLPIQEEGDVNITVGGASGASGDGKEVSIDHTGTIATTGKGSVAVLAQSIGGGGGVGGVGAIGDADSVQLSFGGDGGSAGDGGLVHVVIHGDIDTSEVVAHGIMAQSIGGGGGYAGNVDLGVTGFGDAFAFAGDGGNAGNGGEVKVENFGNIVTRGRGAMGIFAQSVGGGGGLGGAVGFGIGLAGSVGGTGAGGAVTVEQTGDIRTYGIAAHGIVAQSNGGVSEGDYTGSAGLVTVKSSGNIFIAGADAHGIVAQSLGSAGNGNVEVTVESGSVVGGSGSGVGIKLLDGTSNTVTNRGTVTALSGSAIVGGSGAERIDNYGTIAGNVELGAGGNSINNYGGALLSPLASLAVGTGRPLENTGTLSPGGAGLAQTTALTGNLTQSGTGVLALDVSLAGQTSDRLDVAGHAQLGGGIRLNPIDTGHALTSSAPRVVLTASDGVVVDGLRVTTPTSSIVRYTLSYPSANEVAVSTAVDFAPGKLGGNPRRIGEHINAIIAAGGSPGFAPIATSLINLPDDAALVRAYEKLGPGAVGSVPGLSSRASIDFNDAMHSCRQRDGEQRFIREGECNWMRLGSSVRDQERTGDTAGYGLGTVTVASGVQRQVAADTHVGFGLSYQNSELDSISSDVKGDRFEGGVMVKRRYDATRISGSLSLGYGRYDSRRLVDIAAPNLRAVGKQELKSVALHGRISHDLLVREDAYLRPMVGLGVMTLSRDGYAETGAGGANLHVAKERDTFVSLHPALEFGGERGLDDGALLRPYVRVGLTHFLTENDRHITASLEGAPAGVEPFTVVTKADRTYVDYSLGFDALDRNGWTIRVDYSGQWSRNSSAHALWGKFTKPF